MKSKKSYPYKNKSSVEIYRDFIKYYNKYNVKIE